MRGLPPGIDSSAKGIKSLSISRIPGRRRRRRRRRRCRRRSPRLRRSIYSVTDGKQVYKPRSEVGYVLLRAETKFDEILCSIVCPLLLMKQDTVRIMVRLDDMTLSLR